MKILPETKALEKLDEIRTNYASVIRSDYEHRAKSCVTCDTPGACCLDEHFVNVHISRLEAVAINKVLDTLSENDQNRVRERTENTIRKYALTEVDDTFASTYACPLFDKTVGCLVHVKAKPLPCIQHACYENANDLPPSELLAENELTVDDLNLRSYGKPQPWLPIPVAIQRWR
jgi:hypothetical protein